MLPYKDKTKEIRSNIEFARKNSHRRMALIYGGLIFFSTLLTVILSAYLTYFGITHIPFIHDYVTTSIVTFLLVLVVVSSFIGMILTIIIVHFPLRPISRIISAVDTLANGDFTVRVPDNYTLSPMRALAKSVNRLAEELGNTELLRSDFIDDFSHEFKTPIVSIRGFARILKSGNCTEEEKNEYLDIILEESTRLASLSTNVLNLNRIEKQTIRTNDQLFNFAEMVRRVILMLETKWSRKNISLDIDLDELDYYGDPDLLSQLCINIIDNAIKFSPFEGDVKISLKPAPEAEDVNKAKKAAHGSSIIFTVEDHGAGMTPDEKDRVFEKFFQGDSSHSTEGNGLGLSVVQKIVNLYNGHINIESTPGEGSTFIIEL